VGDGFNGDAVAAENVEGVRDLPERTVDVRQGQVGEMTEAARVLTDQPSGELVDLAGEGTSVRVVAEVRAGRGHRQHRGTDATVIHHSEVAGHVPGRPAGHSIER